MSIKWSEGPVTVQDMLNLMILQEKPTSSEGYTAAIALICARSGQPISVVVAWPMYELLKVLPECIKSLENAIKEADVVQKILDDVFKNKPDKDISSG